MKNNSRNTAYSIAFPIQVIAMSVSTADFSLFCYSTLLVQRVWITFLEGLVNMEGEDFIHHGACTGSAPNNKQLAFAWQAPGRWPQLPSSRASENGSVWGLVSYKKLTHYFDFQYACPKLITSGFLIGFVSWMGEAQIGAGDRAGQEAKLSKTSRHLVISGKNPIRQFFPLFVDLVQNSRST